LGLEQQPVAQRGFDDGRISTPHGAVKVPRRRRLGVRRLDAAFVLYRVISFALHSSSMEFEGGVEPPHSKARTCTLTSAAFALASGGKARNLPAFHTPSAISSFVTVYWVHTKSRGAGSAGPRDSPVGAGLSRQPPVCGRPNTGRFLGGDRRPGEVNSPLRPRRPAHRRERTPWLSAEPPRVGPI
jgi:hypothetical protein